VANLPEYCTATMKAARPLAAHSRAPAGGMIMPQIGAILAASGNLGILYAERLLEGVEPEQFARLARPGGQVVQSNHPAFILGHLALYPPRIMRMLGQPAGETAVPDDYEALFKAGNECRDDPAGSIYPKADELTRRFFAGYRAAINAISTADDTALTQPNPTEGRARELFPTIGAAIGFYIGGHVQNHLGQFSAWRRAMGLSPA
jgi:hypothetical protein